MIRTLLILALFTTPVYSQCECSGDSNGDPDPGTSGHIQVSKGSLYYEETGNGPAVILIHGGFLDRRMWDPQFMALGQKYRAIRYDARHHGLSRTLPDTFSNHEDLNSLMEGLGVEKAVLVGLSMGGGIALDFALSHPEKVRALVLVSSGLSGYEFKDAEIKESERKMQEAAEKSDLDSLAEYFQRAWTDGPRRVAAQVDPKVRSEVRDMIMGTLRQWEGGAVERPATSPAIGRLGEIHVPTMVVVADLDMPAIHEIARLLEKDVAGAKKTVITGAAHMVNMEKPQEFNSLLFDFLSGLKDWK